MKRKRMEAPEWVFSWRGPRGLQFPFVAALLICAACFALLFSSVRIMVTAPVPWAASKASLIRVLDDVDGRALSLMAREGGPFPSRFDPMEWAEAHQPTTEIGRSASWKSGQYVPKLREITLRKPAASSRWAEDHRPVLPTRKPPAAAAKTAEKTIPRPVVSVLSGTATLDTPGKLPPFEMPAENGLAAESWRFLLRLDTAGAVLDAFPLSGTDKAGLPALDGWLRRLSFKPDAKTPERWIAIAVSFGNTVEHGTDDQ